MQKWNDKAIADLNAGVKLPETLITVVHRSDGSGTSFNFTNYLSKVSPEWKEKVGEGTTVSWPAGVGGKGNEGVAAYVKQIKDSIGYVEYAYALQNKLTYVQLQNARRQVHQAERRLRRRRRHRRLEERQRLQPDHDQRAGRRRMADHRDDVGDHVQEAEERRAKRRPRSTSSSGRSSRASKQAEALDYVPLPDALVKQIEAYWKSSSNLINACTVANRHSPRYAFIARSPPDAANF